MNNRVKVLHIAQGYTGIFTYIQNIFEYIDLEKFELSIICSNPEIKLFFREDTKYFFVNYEREISFSKDLLAFFMTLKYVKEISPDLIHCHSAKSGIIARLAAFILRIPIIYTPHAFSYLSSKNRIKYNLYLFIEKFFIKLTSLIVVASPSEVNRAVNEVGYNIKKVEIFPNSIKKNLLPKSRPAIFDFEYICSVGRPSYQKNSEMLFKAFIKIKAKGLPFKFVLVGAGLYSPLKTRLIKLINEYGFQDEFIILDVIEHEETLNIVANSYCYLCSSIYEALPYAVIEAMWFGIPVIATNADGNRDCVIDGQTGYLVEIDNDKEMAEAVSTINSDKSLYDALSKNSKVYIENNFSIEENIVLLQDIYSKTMGKQNQCD